jgi:hypothetical protein
MAHMNLGDGEDGMTERLQRRIDELRSRDTSSLGHEAKKRHSERLARLELLLAQRSPKTVDSESSKRREPISAGA